MIWQAVLDAIDAVESWVVGQSYWVQVILLLAVLGPLCWGVAGLIDRGVEALLASHSRRDAAARTANPSAEAGATAEGVDAGPSSGSAEQPNPAAAAPDAPAAVPAAGEAVARTVPQPEPVSAAARPAVDRPSATDGPLSTSGPNPVRP